MADKEHGKVVAAIEALEKESPALGGEELKEEIEKLREDARKAGGKKPPAKKTPAEVLIEILVPQLAKDPKLRDRVTATVVKMGRDAVPPLIKHGLLNKDAIVQKESMALLEKVTGHKFGVPDSATAEQRAKAITAWIEWWGSVGKDQKPAEKNAAPAGE